MLKYIYWHLFTGKSIHPHKIDFPKYNPNPTTSGNSRFYTNDNINNFKKSLESIDFRDVLKINCPNLAYKCFIDKNKIAFDKAFPLQKIKMNKKYIKKNHGLHQACSYHHAHDQNY